MEGAYTQWACTRSGHRYGSDLHTVERRDIHTPGYTLGGDIHTEGIYTWRNIHTMGTDTLRETHMRYSQKLMAILRGSLSRSKSNCADQMKAKSGEFEKEIFVPSQPWRYKQAPFP